MIIENFTTKYVKNARVNVRKNTYEDTKNLALRLVDAESREPLCIATVNPPDGKGGSLKLPAGQVGIKDWGENEGVAAALIAAGVIEWQPVQVLRTGFVDIHIYRLTAKAKAAFGVEG